MNNPPRPFLAAPRAPLCKSRQNFLAIMLLALAFVLPINQVFAQSSQAEIEFWQTVKNSQDPTELQAYLDVYPQGEFAPLARIRINKLTNGPGTAPVDQTEASPLDPVQGEPPESSQRLEPFQPSQPFEPAQTTPAAPVLPPAPPPDEIPIFKPEEPNVTDEICRQQLGPQGVAASDFSGTASICRCRPPFEISSDGTFCVQTQAIEPPPRIIAPPQPQIRRPVPRPRPTTTERRRPPPAAKRRPRSKNYPKRPPRAQARAIANRYCRNRYGKNLRSVVVKKSKFYCHYSLDGGSIIAVKKKKFKNIRR